MWVAVELVAVAARTSGGCGDGVHNMCVTIYGSSDEWVEMASSISKDILIQKSQSAGTFQHNSIRL